VSDVVVTLDQVKDLIKTEKLRPSDVFGMDALESDPAVKGLAEDRVRERIAGEFKRRKEAEEKLEKLQGEQGGKEAALQEEIKGLKINAAKSQLGPLFEKQKAERKLDERQAKYIQNRLARFAIQKPDEIEKEFNAFLDGEIDEYGRVAKEVFGIEEKGEGGGTGTGKVKPAGAEPHAGDKKSADSPYLDPAKNPFIKAA